MSGGRKAFRMPGQFPVDSNSNSEGEASGSNFSSLRPSVSSTPRLERQQQMAASTPMRGSRVGNSVSPNAGNQQISLMRDVHDELSLKKAIFDTLDPSDTDPGELELLQIQIASLQAEFDRLTMAQDPGRNQYYHQSIYEPTSFPTSQLLSQHNSLGHQVEDLVRTPSLEEIYKSTGGSQLSGYQTPNGSSGAGPRKRGFSQVDPTPSREQWSANKDRRINGYDYHAHHPLAGPSGTQLSSMGHPHISNDEALARRLQHEEVIDLTDLNEDDDDPFKLVKRELDRFNQNIPANHALGPLQYNRTPASLNRFASPSQFTFSPHGSGTQVKPEPRMHAQNQPGFGDHSIFKEEGADIYDVDAPGFQSPGFNFDPDEFAGMNDMFGYNTFVRPNYTPSAIISGAGQAEDPIVLGDSPPLVPGMLFPLPQHLQYPQIDIPGIHRYEPNRASKDDQETIKALLETVNNNTEDLGDDVLTTPKELSINLLDHQRIGLTWLVNQEKSSNRGGILADEMGLGKTIQALALIIHHKSTKPTFKTTLIVCPVSLMAQWKREIETKVRERHALKVHIHHGQQPKRLKNFQALKQFDVVLTSYGTLAGEFKKKLSWIEMKRDKFPPNEFPFLGDESQWFRVILDECQYVKNHQTQTSRACAALTARYRLCLSGTPMQNSLDDLFGSVRFLHIGRYPDIRKWNQDFKGKTENSMRRLQTLIKGIMLRRRKDSQINGKPLITLPPKVVELIHPIFSQDEKELYDAVEAKVQLRFNKYLDEGTVMRNYTYVLLLLLRLRQVCCHPKMIKDLSMNITEEQKIEQSVLIDQFPPEVIERLKADPYIECPICLEPASDVLLVVPCGHHLCQECLLQIVNQNQAQAMAAGNDQPPEIRCHTCRGPFDQSRTVSWNVFKSIHMPPPEDQLENEIANLDSQIDNALGGLMSDSDSDSDSDSGDDSADDSSDEGSDLDGFIVDDDDDLDEEDRQKAEESEDDITSFLNSEVRTAPSDAAPRPRSAAPKIKKEIKQEIKNEIKDEDDSDDIPIGRRSGSHPSITNTVKKEESNSGASDDDDVWDIFKAEEKDKKKSLGVFSSDTEDGLDKKPKKKGKKPVKVEAKKTSKKEIKGKKFKKKGKKGKKDKVGKGKKPKSRKKSVKTGTSLSDKRREAQKNRKAKKKYLKELARNWTTSAKIEKVREILQKIRENDPSEKTIVFSSFTSFLDLLQIPLTKLDHFDVERYDGSMSAKDRNEAVLNFTDNPNVTVFLVSLKAGNSGLNLTAASQVIMIDPWWNPYVEEQAIDRAHRIGQARPVTVHRLSIEGTVEDRILGLQENKRQMISQAMDETAGAQISRLNLRDLMYLFTGVN